MNALRERWAALAARERLLVLAASLLVAAAVVWLVGVQPAWRTLRSAPVEQAKLEVQWQTMQRLAVEARTLRATPPLAPALAAQALQGATTRLGASGKLMLQGDRAVLTLTGAQGSDIAQWLAEARRGARARPLETRLTYGDEGYNGTIVVAVGSRP